MPPARIAARARGRRGPDRAAAGHRARRPSGCARARCWCSPGGPTRASRRSSTRCSAPSGRWSPRSRAPRATRSKPTPIFSAGPSAWPTPPGCGMRPRRIDRLGVEVSRRYLAAADLVLLCVEAGAAPGADEPPILASGPTLLVRTKADLDPASRPARALAVSAVTGEGLDALRRAAAERVFGDRIALADLEPALTRERHRTALARARRRRWPTRCAQLCGREATPCSPRTTCGKPTTALDELRRGGRYRGGAGSGVRELLRGEVGRSRACAYAVWIPRASVLRRLELQRPAPAAPPPAPARPPAPRVIR